MKKTQRYVQILTLKPDPDLIRTYKEWHTKGRIFPEVVDGLRAIGIEEMEIYIADNRLVMIVEAGEDFRWEEAFATLSTMPRQGEWESLMAQFQECDPGASSSEKWKMTELFFKLSEM
ncbi:MAG: L-rhamnose mutarotase [Porphyromonas sp.]|nr:L-rhamnose mutarotase [Porphyromonas sp.]